MRLAGKSESKVAAVFAFTTASCHETVLHLRKGAPGVPVCLFTTTGPLPETSALCDSVTVHRNGLILLFQAQRKLWRHWVALGVTSWTGGRGHWAVKLAPFLVPPFRVLILNENGDFFAGSPAGIARHADRRLRDAAGTIWNRIRAMGHNLKNAYSDCRLWLSAVALQRGLHLVSTFLQLLRHPNRTHFGSLHGSGSLDLPARRGSGEGVVVFVQNRRRWEAARLERFARSSTARWILWTETPSPERLAASAFPLDLPGTFAVSRQSGFRGWKAMMFATAPFRTVPWGAACQVLAPVSDAIMVDREKLLELGIPRTTFSLTAWMILFWKAAAAGWRSYSIGGTDALLEQPDFPMQEASFLLRFLRDSALNRLTPREPELSRGAVSFPPALHARSRAHAGRLRVLLVSPFLPYPLSHGGAVRIFNLCRALAGRVDFALIAIRENGETVDFAKLGEVFQQVYLVDIDERASADDRLPAQVRGYRSGALRALIADVAHTWKPDLLQVEYTHMAGFADAAPEIPAILVEHDVTFQLYRQLANSQDTPAATTEYHRWLDFEREWLARYRAVWTVSEQDRTVVINNSGRPAEDTFVVPNGVDVRRFTPGDVLTETPVVFYVGSFRHVPNVLGFEALLQHVMPRVWSGFPKARLCVVAGPHPDRYWNKPIADSRVEVLSFVEDLRPLYAQASVVVVPLEVSAGTNIKVLEAMACGRAIVTTSAGCAGLGLKDGLDILIRDSWDSFADAAGDVLTGRHEHLGMRARRTAEERFSWTGIADRAFESYQAVATPDTRTAAAS